MTLRLNSGRTIKFAVDVKPEDDAWQVIIRELHEPEDQDLATVKVELSHSPSRITRRFYSAQSQIEHRFEFRGVDREEIDNFEIFITSRDELRKNAVEVAQPLRVLVATGGN